MLVLSDQFVQLAPTHSLAKNRGGYGIGKRVSISNGDIWHQRLAGGKKSNWQGSFVEKDCKRGDMEDRKQVGSSSSFPSDLFGAKNSSSSSSSSKGIFGSVFSPASTEVGRDSSRSELIQSLRKQDYENHASNTKQRAPDSKAQSTESTSSGIPNMDRSSFYQTETTEPCYLSSSLYYGGQDVYSNSSSTRTSGSNPVFKKDGGEDDPNGNNLNSASRGNWWQGSLYY